MKITVPLRQDGRVVIPRPVRDDFDLDYGDLIELDVRPVGKGDFDV